jgi:hypothetical protein
LLKRYSGDQIKKCVIAGEWNTLGEEKIRTCFGFETKA